MTSSAKPTASWAVLIISVVLVLVFVFAAAWRLVLAAMPIFGKLANDGPPMLERVDDEPVGA